MSRFRRRLMMLATQRPQPSEEYTELNYIETTGTQYIDTGLLLSLANNYEANAEIAFTKNVASGNFALNGWNYGGAFGYSGGKATDGNSTFSYIVMSVFYKFNSNINCLSNVTQTTFASSSVSRANAGLMNVVNMSYLIGCARLKDNMTSYYSCEKIKSFSIKQNDVLVRDFIPVMRKSDNAVGLLDRVENKFYENAGTDVFLYG